MRKKLRVLFMQNKICPRALKEAKALTQKGISVSLVELADSSNIVDYSIFKKHFNIPLKKKYTVTRLPLSKYIFVKHFKKILKDHRFDIIHTHNAPDVFAVWVKRCSTLPVVHDIHDIGSLVTCAFFPNNAANLLFKTLMKYWEFIACKICDALISPTMETKIYLDNKYNIRLSTYLENKPVKIKIKKKDKLSDKDGNVHLVYEGGLSEIEGSERNMMPIFNEITRWEGFHVHVYPVMVGLAGLEEIQKQIKDPKQLHIHNLLPLEDLLFEMSQYDYGLLLFPIMTDNLRRASANKTYEYQISGLPVINNLEGHTWNYVKKKGCGENINNIGEINKIVKKHKKYNLDTRDCFMDIEKLLQLYEKVLS